MQRSLTSNQIILWIILSMLPWTDVISPELKCPDESHRPLRAKGVCFPFTTTYTCLLDTNKHAYIEICSTAVDFATLGEHFVITGNLRNIDCDQESYQPFSLWSNVSSQCMHKKSACNDEGQTIHDNGTTTEDRSCRCDSTNGYGFVFEPRHVSYCIPSEEDCSCFRVECSSANFLNSDYRCTLNTIKEQTLTSSTIIVNSRNEEKDILKELTDILFVSELEKNLTYSADKLILTAVVIIFWGFGLVMYVRTQFASSTAPVIKLVGSIDLGTTYSGYASSTVQTFEKDPLDIRVNPRWLSGYRDLYSEKTPTCVLLKKKDLDFELIAIGYDAQNSYAYLSIDNELDEYLFFDKFKMILYNNEEISDDMVIEDIRGNKIKASIVFTHFIAELTQRIIKYYSHVGISLAETKWVVTVPAVWTNKAKHFMRRCTNKAGIEDDKLLIVLESEAVSVYFQYLTSIKKKNTVTKETRDVEKIELDDKYLVVDIGGGTVDITAHEKLSDGNLTELCKSTGDNIGGTMVDKKMLQVFESIIGKQVMDALCTFFPHSYNDFIRELEKFKENIFLTKQSVYFQIPSNSLNTVCKKLTGKEFLDLVKESEYKTAISVTDDRISLVVQFFIDRLRTVVNKLIKNIEDVLKELEPAEIKSFLVVGGFSQSKYVQSELEKFFPNVNIIIPHNSEDANLAVVKGAVLYGHRPNCITSRKTHEIYEV